MRVVIVQRCPLYYEKGLEEILVKGQAEGRISRMVPNPTLFVEQGEVIEGTNIVSDPTGKFLEDQSRPGLYVDLSHTDFKNLDAA